MSIAPVNNQEKARQQQAIWQAYDRFVVAALKDCMERIEGANGALNEHAKKVSVQTLGLKDASAIIDGVTNANEMDEQKFAEVSATIKNFTSSEQFLKLLGLIKHSSLLQKQLGNMVAVVTKLNELDNATGDREMKQQFMKYGMDLSHIWRHCEEHCSTIMERKILRAVVSPSKPAQPQVVAKKAS